MAAPNRSRDGDALVEQLLAWATVRGIQKIPASAQVTAQAVAQVRSWIGAAGVNVQADVESEATTLALARIADAAAQVLGLTPVFIRLKGKDWPAALEDWAKSVLSWAEPEQLKSGLGRTLEILQRDAYRGLESLLGLERVLIVFVDSGQGAISSELASAVARGPGRHVVLVTATGLDTLELSDWINDRMQTEPAEEDVLRREFERDPNPLVGLAVLDLPLSDRELSGIGFNRERFPKGMAFLFESQAGPVLAASARRQILAWATPEQKAAAHRLCADLLERAAGAERIKLELLRHLVSLGERERSLAVARDLIDMFGVRGSHHFLARMLRSASASGRRASESRVGSPALRRACVCAFLSNPARKADLAAHRSARSPRTIAVARASFRDC